jgi:hypothetical protein
MREEEHASAGCAVAELCLWFARVVEDPLYPLRRVRRATPHHTRAGSAIVEHEFANAMAAETVVHVS